MKTITISIFLLMLFYLFGCNDSSLNIDKEKSNDLEYFATVLKGCNIEDNYSSIKTVIEADTVIINTFNDTTTISVNLFYICSWKFDNTYMFGNDTLFLTITDTCTTNCGAWCMCDYIFDYKFSDLSGKGIVYKAYFESLRDDSRVIGTGLIP